MLQIKALNAGYDGLKVLKDLNIEVKANEIVALIGPNGAGKSTVIKSVFNIADVYSGKIIFKGADITELKTHELVELGISYVNQGRINFDMLTVRENLEIGAEHLDKKVMKENMKSVCTRVPMLRHKENAYAYTLSGGQRQMLALGRALMQNPSLLLMDEQSLGLSPKLQKELFAMIGKLREDGISILIVEQNAKKAIEMADRTYLMENGEIVLSGDREIIKHKKIKDVYLGGHY